MNISARVLVIVTVLALTPIAKSAEVAVYTHELAREIASRDLAISAETLIELCEAEEQSDFCDGYFSAVIAQLSDDSVPHCVPRNEIGRYEYEGVWSLVKAWLYRFPKDQGVTFYNAVKSALVEQGDC